MSTPTEPYETRKRCPICKQLVRLDEKNRFHAHGRPIESQAFIDEFERCLGSGLTFEGAK